MDEDLKNNFIIDDNPNEARIEGYIKRLMPYCKTTKTGAIVYGLETLGTLDKIKSALVARYLANFIEPSISAEINHEEFFNIVDIPKNQLRARLKDVRKDKFATSGTNGYKVKPQEINKFLTKLADKYGKTETK
jgi:hypothetical protein